MAAAGRPRGPARRPAGGPGRRDGGLADLLEEARSPSPRFAAVVVEDIDVFPTTFT